MDELNWTLILIAHIWCIKIFYPLFVICFLVVFFVVVVVFFWLFYKWGGGGFHIQIKPQFQIYVTLQTLICVRDKTFHYASMMASDGFSAIDDM